MPRPPFRNTEDTQPRGQRLSIIEHTARPARQPAGHTAARAPAGEYLSFRLGAEEYGIDILRIQEIRRYAEPTRIASAPLFVKGVIDLRGIVIPIVDLRLRFGLADARYDGATVTVVLDIGAHIVGVVVDSVCDVVALCADEIQPAPQLGAAIDAGCISGLGTVKNADVQRMLILLDIGRLLSGSDLGLIDAAQLAH